MLQNMATYQRDNAALMPWLWLGIGIIFALTLLFFLLTLMKRLRKIRQRGIKGKYQETVDALFFSYIFGEQPLEDAIRDFSNCGYAEVTLFRKLAIKTMVGLYRNYQGVYKQRLETYFAESGMAAYSMSKLHSRNWVDVVEGLRDLSGLNYVPAVGYIESLMEHRREAVRVEALIALVRLSGPGVLERFADSDLYLSDWIQGNILYALKMGRVETPDDLSGLLRSANPSFALLAARLVRHYQATHCIPLMEKRLPELEQEQLQVEWQQVIDELQRFTT